MIIKIVRILIIAFSYAAILITMPLSRAAEKPWDAQADEDAAKREMESDEIEAQKEMDSTIYGKVVKNDKAAKSISVQEDGDEENSDINTYFIKPETTFTVVSSVRQIFEGDYVTVDYYSFKGKRFAESVLLERRGHKQGVSQETKDNLLKMLID